jgi:hypothetical protein
MIDEEYAYQIITKNTNDDFIEGLESQWIDRDVEWR